MIPRSATAVCRASSRKPCARSGATRRRNDDGLLSTQKKPPRFLGAALPIVGSELGAGREVRPRLHHGPPARPSLISVPQFKLEALQPGVRTACAMARDTLPSPTSSHKLVSRPTLYRHTNCVRALMLFPAEFRAGPIGGGRDGQGSTADRDRSRGQQHPDQLPDRGRGPRFVAREQIASRPA